MFLMEMFFSNSENERVSSGTDKLLWQKDFFKRKFIASSILNRKGTVLIRQLAGLPNAC